MAQLLVPVPLNPLQKVRHEDGLLFQRLLLDAVELLVVALNLRQLFKLFQLVRQVLEVGGSVVVFCCKVFLLQGPVLVQLLGPGVFVRRVLVLRAQAVNVTFLLVFESLN